MPQRRRLMMFIVAWRDLFSVCVWKCLVKAKFHYAVQLATSSQAGRPASEQDSAMEYGLNWFATRFELSRYVPVCDRSETRHATRSATWIA